MKKMIVFIFILIYMAGFAGCAPQKQSTLQATEVENVSIRIADISPVGATVTIKDTNDPPTLYGEWYKIEKQIDSAWYDVEPVIENYAFSYIGYLTDSNNEVTFSIDWEWLYGKLPAGNYRLLKEVGILDNKKYIAIEFEIE